MTAPRNSRFLRITGVCGAIAPLFSFGLIFYAVAISPWFSWQANALSDLGVYPRPSALPFNVALIGGGVLNVLLVLGVGRYVGREWLGRAGTPSRVLCGMGTAASLIGAVALGLIGVFPENYLGPHWAAAATYFLVTPIGYAFVGAEIWREGRRAHGASAIAAAAGAFLVMTFMPHDGLAVPELVAALLLSSRAFSMGMKLWLESEHETV
jgi:hypothetical membrane protein